MNPKINLVKKIQQKSRSTRLLILWLGTLLVMIIIIAIWLFSFSRSFNLNKTKKEIEGARMPSLFESIKKDFSSFKQELEASLKNINLNNEKEQ